MGMRVDRKLGMWVCFIILLLKINFEEPAVSGKPVSRDGDGLVADGICVNKLRTATSQIADQALHFGMIWELYS